uniref:Uncharacterized protein n=1 Tax=Takifugu rubripes TaxID=31033 RepID=A0A674P1K1_TAKRU
MQRFRTGLFCRHKESRKPSKGSEGKFEQKTLSSSAEERRFALDSQDNEDPLCSTECPENAIPERLHGVTNQEMVNLTLHQEQEIQQMRLYKEDIDKCQDKLKQLCSLLALKEVAERSFKKQTEELRNESKKSWDNEKHLSGLSETLNAKVDELTSLLEAKDTEIDNVKTELQNSQTSVSYLNHMIVNLTERVANLKIAKQTAEEKVHHLSALVKDTECEVHKQSQMLDKSEGLNLEIQEDKIKLATVIQDLEEANNSLKTTNAKLQSEVERTLADHQSLLQDVRNLRKTEKQLARQNTMLNDQLTELQSLDNVQNQNFKLQHKSFQECQANSRTSFTRRNRAIGQKNCPCISSFHVSRKRASVI